MNVGSIVQLTSSEPTQWERYKSSPSLKPSRPALLPSTPLNDMASAIRSENDHFYTDLETGEPIKKDKGNALMLIVSEIAEAFEGERKNLMDDHLPHRKCVEVELSDAVIRILDYAGEHKLDLDGAIAEKRTYNRTRLDHTREARLAPNGKKW